MVTKIQINSKLQMKEKYLGKVEFGEGLYFIFPSTQKKDGQKRLLNMAKLQFHVKILLFILFVNCLLEFVDLTIKMVVKMNSKSRFIYSSGNRLVFFHKHLL